MLVVGLDAASRWENFGYALGEFDGKAVSIKEAGIVGGGDKATALEDIIGPRLARADRAVVAIDAPLGWPLAMGKALQAHQAGEPLDCDKASLFRRTTDRVVRKLTGRQPLEVGADRIARAAHQALEALRFLREASGKPLPVALSRTIEAAHVIEVYPAATLMAKALPSSNYKKKDDLLVRRKIAAGLKKDVVGLTRYVNENPNAFDACLCLAAAKDYLVGDCREPTDDERAAATKEGWIWFRTPLSIERDRPV